jgi:replicative DNA helicase
MESEIRLENIVLGQAINTPEDFDELAQYVPNGDVFVQARARRLWEKIGGMRREGKLISLITVTSGLTSYDEDKGLTTPYIVDTTTAAACSAGVQDTTHAKLMYEKYLLRRVMGEAQKIESLARGNSGKVYEAIEDAHKHLGQILELKPDEYFSIDRELLSAINSITDKESLLLKTGYEGLDRFAGGLTKGEITIIGGRPGHGKTTFMINLLSRMIHSGLRIAFFSRELPNSELLKKLLTLESGKLSYGMVRKGIFEQTDLQELEYIKDKMTDWYAKEKFVMFDHIRDFPTTASEIRKFKPDVVFDDYLQLITPHGRFEQRRLQLEQLVNDYKWIAKENQCAIVLASQLNRAIETRDNPIPQLSDLAESGAIEQVAENVFFVYYAHKVKPDKAQDNIIEIRAAKVRYGETGRCELGFDGDKAKMYGSLEELVNEKRNKKKTTKARAVKEEVNEFNLPF